MSIITEILGAIVLCAIIVIGATWLLANLTVKKDIDK